MEKIININQMIDQHYDGEKTALVCGGDSLTYAQFIDLANIFAKSLAAGGVKKGDRILILMKPGIPYIIAMHGILRAGGVFVPADPDWPEERMQFVFGDCEAVMAVTEFNFYKILNSGYDAELPEVSAEDEYCIYYTSGSTGRPKGCTTTHETAANMSDLYEGNLDQVKIAENCSCTISIINPVYAASMHDYSGMLAIGMTVVIATESERSSAKELAACIIRNNVDNIGITPSQLAAYLDDEDFQKALGNMKFIITSGEKLTDETAELIRSYSDACILDGYGSAEMQICTTGKWHRGRASEIGVLHKGVRLYVLDEELTPVSSGKSGELYVGGVPAGNAHYVNRPDLDAEKYIIHPELGRLFRTGDGAVIAENGTIYLTGRIDGVIKLHGQRIDPDEAESVMEQFSGISKAAVKICREGSDAVLCGYYISDSEIDESGLRSFLADRLPVYMIPSLFMRIDEIPVNANGKKDRNTLPEIDTAEYSPEYDTDHDVYNDTDHDTDHKAAETTEDMISAGSFAYDWKSTVPGGYKTVGEVVLQHRYSDEMAAITAERSISYRDMLSDAVKIVSGLRKEGVMPGEPVAVLMEPGTGYVTAAAAAMIGGYIYVPMTNLWPEERIRIVADECGAAVILTEEKLAELLAETPSGEDNAEGFDNDFALVPPESRPSEKDPCAYLYTSGSTGTPKGVVLTHRMVLAMMFSHENVEVLQLNDEYNRYMLMYNMSFAGTAGMMFSNLLCGRTSVILSDAELKSVDAIAERIIRDRVQWITFTISGMMRYLENPRFAEAVRGITGVCLSGEAVTAAMAEKLKRINPGLRVFDTYGATEMFGVAQRIFVDDVEPDWNVWPTTEIHIMDEDLNELSPDETGELMLGGISPEDGYYLADERLTNEKYIIHDTLGRLFRTGDAAMRKTDGTFRIAGRVDDMIKIHGQRMEPGEIENAMESMPEIMQAAVTVRVEDDNKTLCGFYTAAEDIPEKLIRRHIAERLPYYMIPAVIRRIPEIPVNASGKKDRNALSELLIERRDADYGSPVTDEEKLLCRTFAEVLSPKQPVGRNDDFFKLGGDSISGLRIIDRLRREGVKLEMYSLAAAPVIKDLALSLESAAGTEDTADRIEWKYSLSEEEEAAVFAHVDRENVQIVYPVVSSARDQFRYTGNDPWYIPVMKIMEEEFDIERLRMRFRELTAKRQALRSTIVIPEGGDPLQVVMKNMDNKLFYVDLSGLGTESSARADGLSEGQVSYLRTLTDMYMKRGLVPGGPMIAIGFIKVSEGRYVIWILTSHYILDGTGLSGFWEELFSDKELTADDEEVRDYHFRLETADRAAEAEYWQRVLGSNCSLTQLPVSDGFIPVKHTFIRRKWLGEKLGERIQQYCKDKHVTTTAFFLNLIGMSMAEVCGRDEVCFLVIGNGRNSGMTENPFLTGMYMTRFPFVYRAGETPEDAQKQLWESIRYECIDLDRLGEGFTSPDKRCRNVVLDMMNFSSDGGFSSDSHYLSGVLDEKLYDPHEYDVTIIVNPRGNFRIPYYFNTESCDQTVLDDMTDRFRKNANLILDSAN